MVESLGSIKLLGLSWQETENKDCERQKVTKDRIDRLIRN